MNYKDQKKAVRKIIQDLGLKNQAELADTFGVSQQVVKHWSAGNVLLPKWALKFVECLKKNMKS